MSAVPIKATKITTLRLGLADIPVKLYQGVDPIGLPGELFHEDCGGKIRESRRCELHPDLDFPQTYSGKRFPNKIVPLTTTVKDQLMERDVDMEMVSSHRLSSLSSLLTNGKIVPHGVYQVAPYEGFENIFGTLLRRLEIKKSFLLLTGPFGAKRYCILLPTGRVMTLLYPEEVRDFKFSPSGHSAEISSLIDIWIEENRKEFPVFSIRPIAVRIEAWFQSQLTGKIAKATKAKRVKTKTP